MWRVLVVIRLRSSHKRPPPCLTHARARYLVAFRVLVRRCYSLCHGHWLVALFGRSFIHSLCAYQQRAILEYVASSSVFTPAHCIHRQYLLTTRSRAFPCCFLSLTRCDSCMSLIILNNWLLSRNSPCLSALLLRMSTLTKRFFLHCACPFVLQFLRMSTQTLPI